MKQWNGKEEFYAYIKERCVVESLEKLGYGAEDCGFESTFSQLAAGKKLPINPEVTGCIVIPLL